MTGRPYSIAMLLVALTLAGCADAPQPTTSDEIVDKDQYQMAAGKGAIAGLLIDDRFRPLAGGLVLLQETGATTTSNENGEFQFLDLEPGSYTLRVDIQGHEASPEQVQVDESVFAEANVVARRLATEDSTILTREYTVFVPCSFEALRVSGTYGYCTGDLSGDGYRVGFESHFEGVEDITYMVTEAYFEQEGDYNLVVGVTANNVFETYYAEPDGFNTQYIKAINVPGDQPLVGGSDRTVAWPANEPFETSIFVHEVGYEESGGVVRGAGHSIGVKAQIIQSVFIGEPEVDVETYCTLC